MIRNIMTEFYLIIPLIALAAWAVLTWLEPAAADDVDDVIEPIPDAQQRLPGHNMVDNQGVAMYDPLHERWQNVYYEDGYHPPVRPPTLDQQIRTEFRSRTRYTVIGSVIITWKEITET